MMQFTRISPGTCLGNHFDRRDKWHEGIASIAWSDACGSCGDPKGDPWMLRMQSGPPTAPSTKTCDTNMPPGSAYILTGHAQGRTDVCLKKKVAHEYCQCCWTHGIWNEMSSAVRESITLRVFDPEWGRALQEEEDDDAKNDANDVEGGGGEGGGGDGGSGGGGSGGGGSGGGNSGGGDGE